MGVRAAFISVGDLREVVKFEKNSPSETDSGGEEDNYNDLLVTRGKMRTKSAGSRSLEAGTVLLRNQFELIIRYEQALINELDGDSTVRIVYNNGFYTIESWQIYNERFRYLVFQLQTQHI